MQNWKLLAGSLITVQMLLAGTGAAASGSADVLNDSSWVLSTLSGEEPLSGQRVTLHFADGKVHGGDGCNRYSGSYTATGEKLRVVGPLASTRMACPEPVMRQADAFSNALTRSAAFRKDSRQLTLLDADGRTLATLRDQPRELAATLWRVTGYNNGKQAVVSLLSGSDLTVGFAASGNVSGFAGCNHYHATYSTSSQKIRIGEAAATRRTCAQPDGVMEQEGRFLRALASAATWQLDGDRLELRTAAGALALSLSAADSGSAVTMAPVASVDSTLTYRCGGQRVVLTQRGDKWQLNAGDQSVALRPVAAASGARYVGVSDDRSTFWSKAERASVVVAGQAYPECTLMPPTPGFRAAE